MARGRHTVGEIPVELSRDEGADVVLKRDPPLDLGRPLGELAVQLGLSEYDHHNGSFSVCGLESRGSASSVTADRDALPFRGEI